MRRKYTIGKCQDCGREKRTTVIVFWVNGMKYRVCAECKRAYDDGSGRIMRMSKAHP